MSVATGVTLMGRRQAEALMGSTCAITRTTPADPAVDPETGLNNPPVVTTIYAGKCRLRFPFVRPEQALAAGQQLAKERGILSLPMDGSAGVTTNDIATITANDLDAGSVDMKFRVMGPFTETHATSRRLPVEVVS